MSAGLHTLAYLSREEKDETISDVKAEDLLREADLKLEQDVFALWRARWRAWRRREKAEEGRST